MTSSLAASGSRWMPREVPLSGEPTDFHHRIVVYRIAGRSTVPKLLIDA